VVINDFVAQALAVPGLADSERVQFGPGEPLPGRAIGVIGAGTGLGVGGLLPTDAGWLPIPSEGGHTSCAAHDAHEARILERLWARFGHVSNERLLAGPGLVNLAVAIAELDGVALEGLEPKDVELRARAGSCAHSIAAIRFYSKLLGAAAGDVALMFLARGGIYLAGGVLPRLGELFDVELFREGFEAKGRLVTVLREIPTYLVTAGDTGLRGSAACPLHL
jgi:glucokinase